MLQLKALIIAVSISAFAPCAAAGPFEDAQAEAEKGNYKPLTEIYMKLAAVGDARAQATVGNIYYLGLGVPENYSEAVKWYEKAAAQADGQGQLGLGTLYFNGHGVMLDYIQAHKWFNLAAVNLDAGDMRNQAIKGRELVAGRMTPAQIAEAQRLAAAWKPE